MRGLAIGSPIPALLVEVDAPRPITFQYDGSGRARITPQPETTLPANDADYWRATVRRTAVIIRRRQESDFGSFRLRRCAACGIEKHAPVYIYEAGEAFYCPDCQRPPEGLDFSDRSKQITWFAYCLLGLDPYRAPSFAEPEPERERWLSLECARAGLTFGELRG